MVYVFYFASFVILLREVLRPGVLWFLRNLNDPGNYLFRVFKTNLGKKNAIPFRLITRRPQNQSIKIEK